MKLGFDYARVEVLDIDETVIDELTSDLDVEFDESDFEDEEELVVSLTDVSQGENNHMIPELDINDEDPHEEMLSLKLSHVPEIEREEISSCVRDANVFAWSLTDVRPTDVPVSHF